MLNETNLRQLIQEAVPTVNAAALAADAKFEDAGLDSLDYAAILLALQERHSLKIPDEDLEKTSSIADILAYARARA
jgi:acyl carrier protein